MEAKSTTADTSSVRKRKQLIGVKAKLVQLNKKQRRHVVNVTKLDEERNCSDAALCEWQENDRSSISDHVDDVERVSCCSSNGSSELVEEGGNNLKFVDLKNYDEAESQTYNPLRERRPMANSTSLIQSQPTLPRRHGSNKTPTELEMEEFFAAIEKDIQSKFLKKYNFDVTKDEPLEGRYEWTRLKP